MVNKTNLFFLFPSSNGALFDIHLCDDDDDDDDDDDAVLL